MKRDLKERLLAKTTYVQEGFYTRKVQDPDCIKAVARIKALEKALRDAAGALHGAADVFLADGNDSAAETAQESSGRARAVLEDKS